MVKRVQCVLKQVLIAMGLVLVPALAQSTTYYVATTGSDTNTCTQAQDSSTPKQTINAALNCLGTAAGAGAGHTVQVAPGTYVETINNTLPGGTSWSAPFTLKATTIGTVTIQPPATAASCLMIARATSKYAIISGFVCDATNATVDGIKLTDSSNYGASSFIRLQDVEVKNANRQGILVTRSTDNEFIRISSHDNGTADNLDHGIYLGEAAHRSRIEDSLFYNNHTYGIQLYNLTTPPDGCIVRNNRSFTNGTGGLVIWATNTVAYNNLIYNNHTAAGNLLGSAKSGIKVGSVSNAVKLYNNTVYGQKANSSDMGIEVSSGAVNTEVKNNITYNNATNLADSGTGTVRAANLASDPKFVNAAGGNFALQAGSPAIDQGITLSAVPDDYTDVARPQGSAYDIGGYEFVSAPAAFDFALTNGGNQSVTQGAAAISTLTATLVSGTAQSLSFSTAGLPTGATAVFAPTTCSPTCVTTLTVSTAASTPTGTYTISVTGTAGGVTHTTSFSLTVNPASTSFNFSLTNGGSRSVTQGASVSNSIGATLVSGTAQAVSFSASGVPTGATAVFTPITCTPTCAPTLTLTTAASTPTGSYTITVTSTGGGVTKTTSFSLAVTAPSATTTTVAFQDGVWPTSSYSGTRDTYLDRNAPSTNYGSSATLWVEGDTGRPALLRWKNFTVPAGSTVKSATITLNVTDPTSGTYNLYALKRDWWEGYATWNSYGPGYSWEVPGATGTSDRGTTVVGTVTAPATGQVTITLNAAGIALVQAWVNSPSTNNGIIIDNPTVTDGLAFASREAATASNRPKLTVTYGAP